MAIQRTLSIIKPDATRRNLTGAINKKIEGVGLRIIAQKRIKLSKEQAGIFYLVHKGRPFYDELCEFMASEPIVVQVLEGENAVAKYTGSKYAIAVVNGTAALHTALILAGVKSGDEVITQSLTFVATCNAIRYCNADPIFVDVSKDTLGLSQQSMQTFLENNCEIRDDGFCWNKKTNKRLMAFLPVNTYGFPSDISGLKRVCKKFNINLVEDSAESLGSFSNGKHTGSNSSLSTISFNGNKIITTGGGGVILTNNNILAKQAKHITTTAKIPHQYKFDHDEIGYNYRLPNLNAALGVAQMEQLPEYLKNKREIATKYQQWGERHNLQFITESVNTKANIGSNDGKKLYIQSLYSLLLRIDDINAASARQGDKKSVPEGS